MKAKRLPQGSIMLEVIENLQEITRARFTSGVNGSIIANLQEKELTVKRAAFRHEKSAGYKAYHNGSLHQEGAQCKAQLP